MRPPFAYYGGKGGMARRIVSLLPPHRVYIEPFLGSGAVLLAKSPSTMEIVNDLDGAVVAFFRCLRDQPDELERVCRLTPYARDEFTVADTDAAGIDDLERARRFFVRVNQSFAKTGGDWTGWSVTTARTQSPPASTAGRIDRFARIATRLAAVMIENTDAAGLVDRLAGPDAVVYADPPYPASTRSNRGNWDRSGYAGHDYRHDMADEASHRRLAASLRSTEATVILSGYPCDLYDDLYSDWWTTDIDVTVHSSNGATSGRGRRTERLWCNRPLDHGRLFGLTREPPR